MSLCTFGMYCFDVPSLRKRRNALQHRQHRLLLGLFIAYERNKGKDSFWHPYLDLLPEEPGCAWLMQPEHLSNALAAATRTLGEASGTKTGMLSLNSTTFLPQVCSQLPFAGMQTF